MREVRASNVSISASHTERVVFGNQAVLSGLASVCANVQTRFRFCIFVSNARSAFDTMSLSWQFPTKKVVNKRCESGPIRMSFVVDRKVFVDHELYATASL